MLTKPFSELTREEAEKIVKDAEHVLRAEYWADVRGLAHSIMDELRDQIKDGNSGEPLREWLIEHINETIDGNERVIYTWQAQKTLLFTENQDAYVDQFGKEGIANDGAINWSGLAYCALEADVMEQLDAEGIDINDPDNDETKEALGLAEE